MISNKERERLREWYKSLIEFREVTETCDMPNVREDVLSSVPALLDEIEVLERALEIACIGWSTALPRLALIDKYTLKTAVIEQARKELSK